jgi:hypothetical protein
MKITATKPQFNRSLEFDHDPESRAISGPDAALVESLIEDWPGYATIYGTQYADAADPLGSSRDMAVLLLAWGWELSQTLVDLLPPPLPVPEGAVA